LIFPPDTHAHTHTHITYPYPYTYPYMFTCTYMYTHTLTHATHSKTDTTLQTKKYIIINDTIY